MSKTALLLVDLQNDFFPGGALAIEEGDQILAPVNALIERFQDRDLPVIATRDWHPPNHCSFEQQGGQWPAHCVQETEGAAFNPSVRLPESATVVSKATHPDREAYSGFDGTALADRLRERQVTRLVVAGLATDVCVKNTVVDACREGFEVEVVPEAIRGVEANPGDCAQAVRDMREQGAALTPLENLTL